MLKENIEKAKRRIINDYTIWCMGVNEGELKTDCVNKRIKEVNLLKYENTWFSVENAVAYKFILLSNYKLLEIINRIEKEGDYFVQRRNPNWDTRDHVFIPFVCHDCYMEWYKVSDNYANTYDKQKKEIEFIRNETVNYENLAIKRRNELAKFINDYSLILRQSEKLLRDNERLGNNNVIISSLIEQLKRDNEEKDRIIKSCEEEIERYKASTLQYKEVIFRLMDHTNHNDEEVQKIVNEFNSDLVICG